MSWFGSAALCAALAAAALAAPGEWGFSRSVTPGLISHYTALFGQGVRRQLQEWQEFVRRMPAQSAAGRGQAGEIALLAPVNRFFNGVPSVSDQVLWNVVDYWATPAETLSVDGGDCEDYAIGKYFTLKELGVPVERLRLVYARTWFSPNTAHMVLAYYASPAADPLILDNLQGSIQPARDRPDLTPVYSFNDDDLQVLQSGGPPQRLNPSSSRKWRSVLEKLQRELSY